MPRKKQQEGNPDGLPAVSETGVKQGTPGKYDALAYETALAMLEATVAKLENGSMPLADSLDAFDEGIGLVRHLTGRLDAMEQRMLVLLEGKNGPVAVPFDE